MSRLARVLPGSSDKSRYYPVRGSNSPASQKHPAGRVCLGWLLEEWATSRDFQCTFGLHQCSFKKAFAFVITTPFQVRRSYYAVILNISMHVKVLLGAVFSALQYYSLHSDQLPKESPALG